MRRRAGTNGHSILDPTHAANRRGGEERARHGIAAGALSTPAYRGGGTEGWSRALRAYAWRTGGSARRRRAREGPVPDSPGSRPTQEYLDLCEPRNRNGLRSDQNQLPAGGRCGDAAEFWRARSVINERTAV